MKEWYLGSYIDGLLERKNWNRARLAKETGLSNTYIGHIIRGYTADKPNPPTISIDVLLLLARHLGVSPMDLLDAYQGKKPGGGGRGKPSIQEALQIIEDALKERGELGEGPSMKFIAGASA